MKQKKLVLIAACSVLALFAAGCGKKQEKINPIDFVKAEYDGFEGHSSVSLTLDKEKIADKCKEIRDDKSVLDSVFLEELLGSLKMEYDDDSMEHKNGDKIKVKFTWEEDLEADGAYKISSDEEDFEISGLEKAEEIDPFEGIEVTFSGVAPQGQVEYNTDGCNSYAQENGYYSIDSSNNYELSNGDKVTIKYGYYENTYFEDKKIVTQDTKEYTVEGLSEYVTTATVADFTEYNTAILEEVKAELSDWDAYDYKTVEVIEDTWPDYTFETTPEFYQGYYAYDMDNLRYNAYIAVYKVSATATVKDAKKRDGIKKGQKFTNTFYYAVETDTVTKDPTGKMVIEQQQDWWTGEMSYGTSSVKILTETDILSDLQSKYAWSYDSITQLQ